MLPGFVAENEKESPSARTVTRRVVVRTEKLMCGTMFRRLTVRLEWKPKLRLRLLSDLFRYFYGLWRKCLLETSKTGAAELEMYVSDSPLAHTTESITEGVRRQCYNCSIVALSTGTDVFRTCVPLTEYYAEVGTHVQQALTDGPGRRLLPELGNIVTQYMQPESTALSAHAEQALVQEMLE